MLRVDLGLNHLGVALLLCGNHKSKDVNNSCFHHRGVKTALLACVTVCQCSLQIEQYCLVPPLPLCVEHFDLQRGHKASLEGFRRCYISIRVCVCRGKRGGATRETQESLQVSVSVLSPNEGLRFRCTHRVNRTLVSSRKPASCLLQPLTHTCTPLLREEA